MMIDDFARKEQRYKDALRAARSVIRELEGAARAPVAVIGMSCLFPGLYPDDAATPEAFYRQLLAGVDSVVPVPRERLDLWLSCPGNGSASPLIEQGAFLGRDIFAFDTEFFRIPPAEARMTDPQHRLMLELAWQAFMDAGIDPLATAGSGGGVFVGKTGTDFAFDVLGSGPAAADDPYTMTGNMHSSLAGRLSYFLDWTGPCLSCETACSTGLVAVLNAVASLRAKDCSLALAGAVNIMAGPTPSRWLNAMRALSPDGRSRAFGAGADGFGRGEGGGMLLLKRLSDAQRDGDRIHAVILGGAVGSDGRSRSFSSPSAKGQRDVISRALKDAGIAAEELGYVETHGTGTPLGDPIEAESLAAFKGDRVTPLLIGSVKSNVGHLEGASGLAGIIKTIESLKHGTIPRSLHCSPPNPLVDFASLGLAPATENTPWPEGYKRRIAGVSSFAIAGTLAHLIVSQAPPENPVEKAEKAPACRVLTLSASSREALPLLAQTCAEELGRGAGWGEICNAAANGRPHGRERLAIVAADEAEASAVFEALRRGKTSRSARWGAKEEHPAGLLFVFSGQGSQHGGMGRELYEAFPEFRAVLDRCEAIAAPALGHSLLEAMFAPADDRLAQTRVTQPAIFSHQAALVELLRVRGIVPSSVMGHSIGEYAAAFAAGVMDLETGLAIALKRGELAGTIEEKGGMAAVLASPEAIAPLIAPWERVALAAINGADTVTLAGPETDLAAVLAALRDKGIDGRPMPVSQAFHCPLIEPVLAPFAAFLRGHKFAAPRVPFLSGQAGEYVTVTDWPTYFVRQTREPVLFARAVAAAKETVFLEIGAGSTLSSYGRRCKEGGTWLFAQNGSTAQGGQNGERHLAQALATLYALGHDQNWDWLKSAPWRPEAAPLTVFDRRPCSPPAAEKSGPRTEPAPLAMPPGESPPGGSELLELARRQCETFATICAAQNEALKKLGGGPQRDP